MKVVYEGALFPGVGGGPRHFTGLSDSLVRAGIDVVHVLPCSSGVHGEELVDSLVELRWFGGRLARQLSYEVSRVLLLLRWWVTRRRVDVWMSRHSFFGVGLILARLVARQVVLEINGPIREEVEVNLASRPLAVVADALMRIQVRAADCVVTVTPGLASYVEKRVPTSRCVVLPNGANPGHATRIPDQRDLSLIFVGALTPWYEMDVVLQALRELRDDGLALSLTVVGDGVRKAELVRQATALRVADLVTFAGWVESDHVQDAIERSQVGLLPLRPKHRDVAAVGSPLKLYEYLAAGLQVVGTDLDGIENAPAAEAVHTYTQGRSHSCAVAIRAALAAAGSPPLEAAVWSWDARATDLIAILME